MLETQFLSWLQHVLSVTRKELHMETAIVSYIEENFYTIVAVDSEMEGVFAPKQVFPLQDTYCRAVYESKKFVSYDHVATIDGMLQHPVYQAIKLESYIAAPIKDPSGEVVGTLNFTSFIPHKPKFTTSDQAIVENLAIELSENLELLMELLK